jgi:hypothetical protein
MTNKVELYHYKPLSTKEHFLQLKNYMNQKVWFTQLAKFNDPFEAQFAFKHASSIEILNNKPTFDKHFVCLKLRDPELTEEGLKQWLTTNQASEKNAQTSLDKIFKSFGAICLTESGSNIPMWAHYADNHQGYCIIFEIDLDFIFNKYKEGHEKEGGSKYEWSEFEKLKEKIFNPSEDGSDQEILSFQQPKDDEKKDFIFTKIIYKEDRPVLDQVTWDEAAEREKKYGKNKYLSKNSFGVKFKQWSHEEEYRLIVNANSETSGLMDLRFYPFIKITGIIMGCKIGENLSEDAADFISSYKLSEHGFKGSCMEEKVKGCIANLAKEHKVEIYLAECSPEKYEIKRSKYM